jgi:GDPmannose 4,6-dehydratase
MQCGGHAGKSDIVQFEDTNGRAIKRMSKIALITRITWQDHGIEETGADIKGGVIVKLNRRYFRPAEVETLLGYPTKAKDKLGWIPKITFLELVSEMVKEDYKSAQRDELVKHHGFGTYDYHE